MRAGGIQARFTACGGAGPRLAVDVSIPLRGVTAVCGPSGAGKTTLLRCLAGFERPSSAYLQVGDEVWHDSAQNIFLPAYRRPVGYVFQDGNLFPHLSVESNLRFALRRANLKDHDQVFHRIANMLDLKELFPRYPHALSGGERQRVAIARALLTVPQLLLLDEPLSALDTSRKNDLLPYLRRVVRETLIPMCYVSHSVEEVSQIADDLLVLEAGRVRAQGSIFEISRNFLLADSFVEEMGSVFEAHVAGSAEDGISVLQILGSSSPIVLYAPRVEAEAGEKVRIRVQARDVSIALSEHRDSSILNILSGHFVRSVPALQVGHVVAEIDLRGLKLLARITERSLLRLNLTPGQAVWIQVKAISIVDKPFMAGRLHEGHRGVEDERGCDSLW